MALHNTENGNLLRNKIVFTMKNILVHPTYFSSILQYIAIVKSNKIYLEYQDNYQKQTYRNRCFIYGANGIQMLSIPIKHNSKKEHKLTREAVIDTTFNWQKQHLKSIQTAYRTSPYFEFYEDDLLPLFTNKFKYLIDLNLKTQEFILGILQVELEVEKTSKYVVKESSKTDCRFLVNAKNKEFSNLTPYYQLFSDKHGFISNLSILDLIFMEGPNALSYLENQSFNFF